MFKVPEDIESKYRFVMLAALRAEQLQAGATPRVENAAPRKPTILAQQELAQGLVAEWSAEQPTEEPAEAEVASEEE